jgi:hypothetical protein
MAKQESIPFVTPWFTARFPKISKPDTKGKFADGKFKTDGDLSDEDYKAVEKALKDAGKKFWPDADVVSIPMKSFYKSAEDKKAKKSPEARGFTLKSKYRPAVFDSKKHKLPENVVIGGGSVLRVASAIFPWSKTEKIKVKDPKTGEVTVEEGTEYGVSLRLGDVQVRKLVEFQAQGDGSAFDEDEDGFTYDGGEDAGDQFGADTPSADPSDL